MVDININYNSETNHQLNGGNRDVRESVPPWMEVVVM
jgi:hypothetical protein